MSRMRTHERPIQLYHFYQVFWQHLFIPNELRGLARLVNDDIVAFRISIYGLFWLLVVSSTQRFW